ncbi:hypothetical protein [Dyadobacter sp. CY343]|uniref:hypothetical protein n=1 Tax=Dyadobacter sp. CY343 TaxID=2907299 RepID=UPI001F45982F|nr:hypothetical protein [Dyadobacter sp. CY343]MCE7058912.1 hypothetical protein [Dyadobacter sp. CY343]
MVSEAKPSSGNRLSDIQISLLRLFDQNLSERETMELRKMMMDYFDGRLRNELDEVLEKKKYTESDYHRMLSDDNF